MTLILEFILPLLLGLYGTLLGFRLLGAKPGQDPEYDFKYRKYVRHLKWLGPLVMAIAATSLIACLVTGRWPK